MMIAALGYTRGLPRGSRPPLGHGPLSRLDSCLLARSNFRRAYVFGVREMVEPHLRQGSVPEASPHGPMGRHGLELSIHFVSLE
jgi:hypothetical protein